MKKTSNRKLRLAAETVRVLQTTELTFVAGGASTTCLSEPSKQNTQMSCGAKCEPPE